MQQHENRSRKKPLDQKHTVKYFLSIGLDCPLPYNAVPHQNASVQHQCRHGNITGFAMGFAFHLFTLSNNSYSSGMLNSKEKKVSQIHRQY